MASVEHFGLWWDPRSPEVQWSGTVLFEDVQGASLRITVPVEGSEFQAPLNSYDLILGIASNGMPITLIHCFDKSAQSSLFGVPRAVTIHARYLILGFHAESVDPLISTMAVSFTHLDEWWGRSGIRHEMTSDMSKVSILYESIDAVVLHNDAVFETKLRAYPAASFGQRAASIAEHVQFEITALTPRPLAEFEEVRQACGHFMTTACLTLCREEEISLVPPDREGQTKRVATFHAVPHFRAGDDGSVLGHMLFSYRDIENRASAVFANWLSNSKALEDVRALYLTGLYGRGFIEHRLLALMQAVEAFHRRYFKGEYLDPAVFAMEVLAPLKAAIPQGIDSSLRDSLKSRLNFANEHSLRKRMRAVFDEHLDVLKCLATSPADHIGAIVDTRNEFTHFPVPGEESGSRKDRPEPSRVLFYNWLLRLLLEACFMSVMGFTKEEIADFVRRSDTYRQISERFREQVI